MSTSAYAVDEVTVVELERTVLEDLVTRKPVLLQDIGRAIEERRLMARRAVTTQR